MDQDPSTCPGCGAREPQSDPCPYCGWRPEPVGAGQSAPAGQHSVEVAGELPPELEQDSEVNMSVEPEDASPPPVRELMDEDAEPEHLLEQVPEDMRALLAARLKASEGDQAPSFTEDTETALRDQGYVVAEDARGARLAASPGQSSDLSASDTVKMAAELDGGVQPQAKLPICGECQAASPVGSTNCQWCGEPFVNEP